MNYIYKYVYQNQIIYIGQTNNLKKRFREHSYENEIFKNSSLYYFQVNNQIAANAWEYFLINKYSPTLNIQYNYKEEIEFSEPTWKSYKELLLKKSITPIKDTFIIFDENLIDLPNKDFLSIASFCNKKRISRQAVYKSIKEKKKWYKYIRTNPVTEQYEIHISALNIPTHQKDCEVK